MFREKVERNDAYDSSQQRALLRKAAVTGRVLEFFLRRITWRHIHRALWAGQPESESQGELARLRAIVSATDTDRDPDVAELALMQRREPARHDTEKAGEAADQIKLPNQLVRAV
jgi:hypothetical protein